MKYCFNCGARIIEENQKFCIKCGTKLSERGKEMRKNFNPREGESYNDYLKRINSPIRYRTASEEEVEEESVDYRDYDALESYREREIDYPESERDDEETDISYEEDTSPYHKEVISEDMFGKPAVSIEGNFVYEGMYGRPKYYVDGDIIREDNQFGRPAYRIDGNYIREGMFGRPKYYIDGDLIRENNQWGKVVGRKRKF